MKLWTRSANDSYKGFINPMELLKVIVTGLASGGLGAIIPYLIAQLPTIVGDPALAGAITTLLDPTFWGSLVTIVTAAVTAYNRFKSGAPAPPPPKV